MQLAGKVALISGGGTGIGAATAARFRAEGAEVVVMGRRRGPLDEAAAATGAAAFVGDAGDAVDARAAVVFATERFGGLDILVPNAGATARGGAADFDDDDWQASIHANLATVYVLCREALPSIIERRGNIVIVSSLAGVVAPPTLVGYITCKHALTGFTKSMARDYGPLGVRVNSVNPGWVRTAMGDEAMDGIGAMQGITRDDAYRLVTKNSPLRRPAEPEEIASICLFLASSESSIITGAIVMADAGASVVDVAMIDVGPTGGLIVGADIHVITMQPGDVRLPARADETIEGALVRSGFVRPRRGCRRGGCGQCIGQVHRGRTRDERPIAFTVLSEQQRADGFVLLCRAVPLSDVEVSLVDGEVRCVSPVQRMLAARELPVHTRSLHTGGT